MKVYVYIDKGHPCPQYSHIPPSIPSEYVERTTQSSDLIRITETGRRSFAITAQLPGKLIG